MNSLKTVTLNDFLGISSNKSFDDENLSDSSFKVHTFKMPKSFYRDKLPLLLKYCISLSEVFRMSIWYIKLANIPYDSDFGNGERKAYKGASFRVPDGFEDIIEDLCYKYQVDFSKLIRFAVNQLCDLIFNTEVQLDSIKERSPYKPITEFI